MYQSLLPFVKPLIFEGKSGILDIVYKYNDTARLYFKEGIIEQVETKKMQGKSAASHCVQWVSFTTTFNEGATGQYTLDPAIDTMSLLSFLEKTAKNIDVINSNIPSDSIIFQVDPEKLNKANKLNEKDLKIASLFNGQRTVAQVITASGLSELAVLTRTCRLVLAGVAIEGQAKTLLSAEKQEDFLDALNDKLIDLVGPAASILVEDGFDEIHSSPETLAKEDIAPLLAAIGEQLDDEEKSILKVWGTDYM
jgi:hypothetical protein